MIEENADVAFVGAQHSEASKEPGKEIRAFTAGSPTWSEKDLRLLEFGRELHALLQQHSAHFENRNYWMAPEHGSNLEIYHLKEAMRRKTEAFLGFPDHRHLFLTRLPPNKSAALARVERDYRDMQVQLAKERQGVWLPEDRERDALLTAERHRDIERLLTPDELFEFRLRTYGPRLHDALADIDLTEEQFRELYRINAERLEQGPTMAALPEVAGVREVLNEEGYNQYRRNIAPGYEDLVRLTDRLELPHKVANEIADMQMSYYEQVLELGREGRLKEVSVLREAGRERLNELLGETGAEVYWNTFQQQILMGRTYP